MKTLIIFIALLVINLFSISQVNLEWVKTYKSTADWDVAQKMELDNQGNIFVSGDNFMSNGSEEITTLKYAPNGDTLWVNKYADQSGNSVFLSEIKIDNAGNIYVAGYSTPFNPNLNIVKPYEFRLNKAENRNIVEYSAPVVAETTKMILIKYSNSGVLLWERTFNGPDNLGATASALTFDNQNNIIIGGGCRTSNGTTDVLVCLVNSSGNLQWSTKYNGPNNTDDYLNELTTDNNGNIFLTGAANGFTNRDCLTMKLSNTGSILWANIYNGPQNRHDSGTDICLDNSGSTYVLGYSCGLYNAWEDLILIKYNSQGVQQFLKRVSSTYPGGGQALGIDLEIDNNNNILALGWCHYTLNPSEAVKLLKYNSNGSLIWERNLSVTNKLCWPNSIVCDEQNNIFIDGHFYNYPFPADVKHFVTKYSSNGSIKWTQHYNTGIDTLQNNTASRNTLKLYDHNIYSLASYNASNINNGFVTLKYNEPCYSVSGQVTYKDNSEPVPAGGHVLAFYYDNSTASIVKVDSAIIQQNGMYSFPNLPQDSLDLMFYQDDDLLQYVPTYYISTTDWREATKIYPNQNLTNINCQVYRINNQVNPFTISGQVLCHTGETTIVPLRDAVIYAKIGDQYKNFGFTTTNGAYTVTKLVAGTYQLTAMRYGFAPVFMDITITSNSLQNVNFIFGNPIGITQNTGIVPKNYSLSQNYPNPFNPVTTIKFGLPKAGNVKLAIFDVLGRNVKTLLDNNMKEGSYSVDWDASSFPSGIYFYRIQSKDFTETKKMVLIK